MDTDKFTQTENFLYALRNAGSKYSLDRIRKFCGALSNPQDSYPVIHVAGTNGKGSVCAMLESILRARGLKTGMYTSPHLVHIGERIQINRTPMGSEEIILETARLKDIADSIFNSSDLADYPSFFEFMTAMAFEKFSREKVDCAVVEVGLGGRLDSTNIVNPCMCAITSIALDHTEFLGNTIEQIALEKAGIIKSGVPVVCGFLPKQAMGLVERIADERKCVLYKAEDFFPDTDSLPKTSLKGSFQRRNAAVAAIAAKVLEDSKLPQFSKLSDFTEKALSEVSWAARWQKIPLKNNVTLILDASHNEEGGNALEENLSGLEHELGGEKPVVCVGSLGRDRAKAILKVVSRHASEIIFIKPDQPRALGYVELRECLGNSSLPIRESALEDVFLPGGRCAAVKNGATIVSTGSIYLAGEVLAAIGAKVPDGLQDRP